ncbi:hypothetical protein [Paraburkholderia diazotrophica]|uniref:Uncharacterized protein n=1 Tax=Paraburkholderia diazotrophica TaxID=667676 RepID=A0A1H7DB96_9BURK|nr:hypothetical protein [Paraburkholderia diazotrophica]SEJ99119.1 hypothetical protein SAMN05192539_102837 [Paraburkholderia diazotrophica]
MTKYPAAMITFYDEETQTFKTCVTLRSRVQTAIDRAVVHTVEPESQNEPITDEHARLLGAMAFLQFAAGNPELRSRLQTTTKEPMNWSPVKRPAE